MLRESWQQFPLSWFPPSRFPPSRFPPSRFPLPRFRSSWFPPSGFPRSQFPPHGSWSAANDRRHRFRRHGFRCHGFCHHGPRRCFFSGDTCGFLDRADWSGRHGFRWQTSFATRMSEVTVSAALVSAPSSNHLQKLSNIHATEKTRIRPLRLQGAGRVRWKCLAVRKFLLI